MVLCTSDKKLEWMNEQHHTDVALKNVLVRL